MAKLTQPMVAALESGENFGVVATVGENGRPQTSIVWVDTDGENLVFNTTNARAKGRNLRSHPWVSVTVWLEGDPHSFFEVQGPVELTDEGATEHIHKLARRYEDRDFTNPTDRVIVTVQPQRVIDHDMPG